MSHNVIAINFKVDYSAMLPTKPIPKTVSFTIGSEVMLPTLNQEGKIYDQKIDFFCQMGPG